MKNRKTAKEELAELIPDEKLREQIIERLYAGDALLGDGGIFTSMLQTFVNAALEGEMDYHLQQSSQQGEKNRRNGKKQKQVRSSLGPLSIQTPRDRQGTHSPKIVKPWERELNTGLDQIILSLYARGSSIEDIRYQLQEIYGVELSSGAISMVTEKVWEEIVSWQRRPLASCYVILYMDAIHYKVRQDGQYITKAIYTLYGIDVEGQRDVLSLHLGESEGANQWGLIMEDLKRRGVEDILICCVDGLSGLSETIQAVYPQTIVQRCVVHKVRNSIRFVSDKDRKAVCRDLRKVYTSANREQALLALEAFNETWSSKYPGIYKKWLEDWDELMVFMDYGEHIRRMIYTTNPVEALHRVLRKVTKSKGAWSSDKALIKQLFLALKHNEKSWKKKAFHWTAIQRELREKFGHRFESRLD